MPTMASKDAATHAALDLIHCLQHPTPATALLNVGDEQLDALRKLAEIFHTALPTPQQEIHQTSPPPIQGPIAEPRSNTQNLNPKPTPSGNMNHFRHMPQAVPPSANTRVNHNDSPLVHMHTNRPMQQTGPPITNTRVNHKTSPPININKVPGIQVPYQTEQTRASTRVPNTPQYNPPKQQGTAHQQQQHAPAYKLHVIPPMTPMPLPKYHHCISQHQRDGSAFILMRNNNPMSYLLNLESHIAIISRANMYKHCNMCQQWK
eukprot:736667-Ditylum_brightwellii.AAC.2